MNSHHPRILGALAAALLAAGTASAAERVTVGDLDLSTRAGQAELRSRIASAAHRACGMDEADRYAERQAARRCVSATVEYTLREARSGARAPQSALASSFVSSGGSVRR